MSDNEKDGRCPDNSKDTELKKTSNTNWKAARKRVMESATREGLMNKTER